MFLLCLVSKLASKNCIYINIYISIELEAQLASFSSSFLLSLYKFREQTKNLFSVLFGRSLGVCLLFVCLLLLLLLFLRVTQDTNERTSASKSKKEDAKKGKDKTNRNLQLATCQMRNATTKMQCCRPTNNLLQCYWLCCRFCRCRCLL